MQYIDGNMDLSSELSILKLQSKVGRTLSELSIPLKYLKSFKLRENRISSLSQEFELQLYFPQSQILALEDFQESHKKLFMNSDSD